MSVRTIEGSMPVTTIEELKQRMRESNVGPGRMIPLDEQAAYYGKLIRLRNRPVLDMEKLNERILEIERQCAATIVLAKTARDREILEAWQEAE